jgi:hypothetical protein
MAGRAPLMWRAIVAEIPSLLKIHELISAQLIKGNCNNKINLLLDSRDHGW